MKTDELRKQLLAALQIAYEEETRAWSAMEDYLRRNYHDSRPLRSAWLTAAKSRQAAEKAVAGMIRRSERYGRGGYVFQREKAKGKTLRLKRISLQRFKRLITEKSNTDNSETKETLSPKLLEQPQEEILPLYGKTLILRKLTPTEKEKLQGFPQNWTLCEE